MSSAVEFIKHPELVFGIAGPIGVDVDQITDSLQSALKSVHYEAHIIKLTTDMKKYKLDIEEPREKDLYSDINFKIDYANGLCKKFNSGDTLARIAIRSITIKRNSIRKKENRLPNYIPQNTAYIIRQLKRPDEVALLRKVYGRQFILISAYGSTEEREKRLSSKLRQSLVPISEVGEKVRKLIERDAGEDDYFGQQLRETFHLADAFISGIIRSDMDANINRFIHAFFGRNDIAPSKSEYGMYAAKSASLRSSDLSRQVGAAIFSNDGELITQGCNEVPKSFGGTYWDLEKPDFRDVSIGQDPNELLKKELLSDLFERLKNHGLLSEKALQWGSSAHIVEKVTLKNKGNINEGEGALSGASVMDLTEYGRVVHAEMCAICDAARLGRSIKGATLYCTTFPCHNRTKHILACGIKCVVYMEPYPKSKAKDLHENEIEIEKIAPNKVSFVPFIGISPYRYRDIFQKGKRKKSDGTARRWYNSNDIEAPMIEVVAQNYSEIEDSAISGLIGQFYDANNEEESSKIEN
ncbi:anti-phage dCTP deaminase [Methylobacterium indicum]|uniref:anti-phage dCTP deaminase n=1 Tax=Methylobacterium indicum TaxID=1775910 RepID=UPI00243485F1|nr:anti-phage dCTP deaminase [Methylobacterium indicum]